MRLNKSTRHAIRILIDCAQADGALVKVADLSARLDITMQHVFKIVHILSRAGLIDAMRGRNGGVMLGRPATEIRIGDVVRAMETTQLEGNPENGSDRIGVARVNQVLDSALEAFVAVLDDHTLDDMARGQAYRRSTKRSA
jgi:Rrf2 family protein